MSSVVELVFNAINKTDDILSKFDKDIDRLNEPVERINKRLRKLGEIKDMVFKPLDMAMKAVNNTAKFGGDVLQKMGQAFDLAAERAEKLGRADVASNIEKMYKAFDTLTDTLVTMDVGGRDFLQWMGDAAEGAQNAANVLSILSIKFQQTTGSITDQEAAAKAYALVSKDMTLSTEQLAQAEIDLADPMDESNRLMRDQAHAAEAAAAAQDIQKAAADKLAFSMGELNKQTVFEAASAGLSAEAKFNLAKAFGYVNEEAAITWDKLQALNEQFNTNGGATLDATEAAGAYTAALIRIAQEADGTLAKLQAITAEMRSQTGGAEGRHGGEVGDVPGGATGLHMVTPPGYPSDSFFVRSSSGEPVDIWRSQAERQAALGGGGDITIAPVINLGNVPPSIDTRGLAQMIGTEIARQIRALKNSHAQTIGQ